MSWLAGFSQASLLLCYMVLGLGVFLAAQDLLNTRRLPALALGWIGLGLCLGLGLAMVQILPAMEAAGHSSRTSAGHELLASRALPPSQLLELVLPGQLAPPGDHSPPGGSGSRPSFLALFLTASWLREPLRDGYLNHTETALGFGVWPLCFALASLPMLARRSGGGASRPVLAFLWTASLVGLSAAMALPGLTHLLLLLPGLALGDLKRLLLMPALCLPLLAALGWRELRGTELLRMLVPASVAVLLGGICLLGSDPDFAARWGSLLGWRYDANPADFVEALFPGEARMNRILLGRGLLILGIALALPVYLLSLRILAPWTFILVTALELLPIAWDASPAPERRALEEPLPAQPEISSSRGRAPRVLRLDPDSRSTKDTRLLPPNMPLLFGLADATGYAPLPPGRSEAFLEILEPGSSSRGAGVVCLRRPGSLESPLAELLGLDALLSLAPPASWRAGPADAWLHPNPVPGAHLRLYDEYRVLPTEQVPAALREAGFAPETTLLLEEDPKSVWPAFEGSGKKEGRMTDKARAELLSFAPGSLELRVESPAPCLLLVAEAWAPGWRYSLDDGTEGRTLPAQLMFQALPVPAGTHELRLFYAPSSFRVGAALSMVALTGILLCLVLPGRFARGSGSGGQP